MKKTIITALLALVVTSSATAIRKIKIAMLRCCGVAMLRTADTVGIKMYGRKICCLVG